MNKKRLKYNGILMLFPVILFGLIGPIEIYSGNEAEFMFGLKDFFWIFLGATAVLWIISVLFLSLIPKKLERICQLIIFAFTFMSYMQNILMNKGIFNVDGSSVDWSLLKTDIIINTVIWLVVFTLIIVANIKWKKESKEMYYYYSAYMSIVLIVTVISVFFTKPYDKGLDDKYMFDTSKQYTVGSEENIILFVLDKYGHGEFDKLYAKDEHLADPLKDFTYYNNMNSTYSYTSPSLVYTLSMFKASAEDLCNDDYRYVDKAWGSDICHSIYSDIRDQGFESNMYTQGIAFVCYDGQIMVDDMDNMIKIPVKVDNALLFRLFTKMTIYKYVPTVIKKPFEVKTTSFEGVTAYLDGEPLRYLNADYYEALVEKGISLDEEKPKKFIVEHIEGTHDFSIDENANRVEEMGFDAGIEKTQKGLMVILDTYFDELKKQGVYDSSTIIIMSDHGYVYEKYDSQPIFFVKPANQVQDKMTVNSAPISSEDIMPTVLSLVGADSSKYGTTIFDWHEGDSRVRSACYPELDYMPLEYDGDGEMLRQLMIANPMKHK